MKYKTIKSQLIKLETIKERMIIESLKEAWKKSPMNFLSFEEWMLL